MRSFAIVILVVCLLGGCAGKDGSWDRASPDDRHGMSMSEDMESDMQSMNDRMVNHLV